MLRAPDAKLLIHPMVGLTKPGAITAVCAAPARAREPPGRVAGPAHRGLEVPAWLPYPEGVELRRTYPVRSRQGVSVFFMGPVGGRQINDRRGPAGELLELGAGS